MIEHYMTVINNYISAHADLGLLFAFLVAFAESLPVLGTLIPGSITMTFIGILVGRNLLPFSATFILAILGALAGDVIGFWIGKHYQDRIKTIWPFRKHPKMLLLLKKGEDFFKKHGGKSIIIGRFIGPTRSSVPLVAGLLKMRWARFLSATIPSAILWALLYLLPGILIGAISLALPKDKAATFSLIGFAIIIFLWLIFWALQRFFVYIVSKINQVTERTWNWMQRHHASKFITRILTSKRNPKDYHQLTLLFFLILLLILFLFIFINVIFHLWLYRLNEPVFHFFQTLRTHFISGFFVVFTVLGYKYVLAFISLLVFIYLALRRQWYICWHLLALFIISAGSVWFLKLSFYSPRPTGFMDINLSSSFPSGHATLSVAILGFLGFLLAQCSAKRFRWIPYTVIWSIIFLIALSRLVLGAHWLCDVLAGICLGASLLFLVMISYRRWRPIIYNPKTLLASIIIAISIPWAYMGSLHYHNEMFRHTAYYPEHAIKIQQWWDHPHHYLPIYRLSRFGHPIQPFNVQWAGQLKNIKKTLSEKGWIMITEKVDLKRALGRFASKAPEEHLAFFPQLYHGHQPVLFMIKHTKDKKVLIVLRLWKTQTQFTDNQLALFIGSTNFQDAAHSYITLHPRSLINLLHGGGLLQLINALQQSHLQWKTIKIHHAIVPKKIKRLNWDQKILVIREQGSSPD